VQRSIGGGVLLGAFDEAAAGGGLTFRVERIVSKAAVPASSAAVASARVLGSRMLATLLAPVRLRCATRIAHADCAATNADVQRSAFTSTRTEVACISTRLGVALPRQRGSGRDSLAYLDARGIHCGGRRRAPARR